MSEPKRKLVMDMKVEEAKKVALKKHGRPRNVGGQHLKPKKEST